MLTSEIAEFAADLSLEDMDPAVLHAAKRSLLDGIGVAIAGLEEPVAAVARSYLEDLGSAQQARLLGHGDKRFPATGAALFNGTIGNALDWDDVQCPEGTNRPFGLLMHATIPVMSAAFAAADYATAQTSNSISGPAFLEAFIAGHEASCKIATAINPDHYYKGFHTSGTVGTFGAAIAAGKILGFDKSEIARAMGIASSLAGGIRASLGTMTKPMHAGWAASKGVEAALLTRRGLSSNESALDGEWGYFAVAGRGADEDLVRGRIGNPFTLVTPGVSIKPFPCGAVAHPGMDAMRQAMSNNNLTAADIQKVTVYAGNNVWGPIHYKRAVTPLEGKYCFPFLLSAIILRGKAGRAEFKEDFIRSKLCQDLQQKIYSEFDADIDRKGYDLVRTRLEIETTDGKMLQVHADDNYLGGPKHHLSDAQIEAKVRDCTQGLISEQHTDQLIEIGWSFDQQQSIDAVFDLIGDIAATRNKGPA